MSSGREPSLFNEKNHSYCTSAPMHHQVCGFSAASHPTSFTQLRNRFGNILLMSTADRDQPSTTSRHDKTSNDPPQRVALGFPTGNQQSEGG